MAVEAGPDPTDLMAGVLRVRAAVSRLVGDRMPERAGTAPERTATEGTATGSAAPESAPAGTVLADPVFADPAGAGAAPARLARLAQRFRLGPFETDLLLLCAGAEIDAQLAHQLAAAAGPAGHALPTFGLAMAALKDGGWQAIGPGSPLRRWRMIEIGPGDTLRSSPIRISERLLLHLLGVDQPDEQLAGVIRWISPSEAVTQTDERDAELVTATWKGHARQPAGSTAVPVVHVVGEDVGQQTAVVVTACSRLGLIVGELSESALPIQTQELESLSRLWEREALLSGAALIIRSEAAGGDRGRDVLRRFLADTAGCIALTGEHPPRLIGRDVVTVALRAGGTEQRRAAWRAGLAEAGLPAGGPAHHAAVEHFHQRYRLGPAEIRAGCRQAALATAAGRTASTNQDAENGDGQDILAAVEQACGSRARPLMDGLADRVTTAARWDDLVLPEAQHGALRGIVRHVRHRDRVLTHWGFAGFRGTAGVTALFSGPSGTGKTMAAGVVAAELGLELYRVDLAGVVDKYIGETEKNLSRIFSAATRSGAVLFFDEADALFGRRSEVRDSHDRYANIQVSYLLQRMDDYPGLAILATNLSTALDGAFLRRLTTVVRFPFPDIDQREQIWRLAFPPQTPTAGLDVRKLAALQVSGGSIRNIALAAAFRAADDDVPVGMGHLLASAVEECAKHERPVSPAEVQGWV